MITSRHSNTRKDILADGNWLELGRKHYLHGSGVEVRYDCNRYGWTVIGGRWDGRMWKSLWAAKHFAEKGAE